MFGLGMPELFIILTLALLIFGPAKLPQLGASLGEPSEDFAGPLTNRSGWIRNRNAKQTRETTGRHVTRVYPPCHKTNVPSFL